MRGRVPVRLQSGLAECGAACLAMVLSHHGHHATVREVGERAGVGRDGLTALALLRAARQYGLQAKAFSVEPDKVPSMPLPAIAHWEFKHFVVVEGWTKAGVRIVDPAKGRRMISHEEFDEAFTGVLLVFAPDDHFQRVERPKRSWLSDFARTAIVGQRWLLAQILLLSLLLQGAGLLVQSFSQALVDTVLPTGADRLLSVLGAGLAVVGLMHVVLGYLRSSVLLNLRIRADAQLTTRVVGHLVSLPYRYFVHRGASDLTQRSAGVSALRSLLTGQVTAAVLDGPLAIGYVTIVLVKAPAIGICLLVLTALQAVLLLATRRAHADLTQRELAANVAAQGQLIEAIQGMETLKASGAEHAAARRWRNLFTAQLNADSRVSVMENMQDTALDSMRFLAPMALLWVGAWQVMSGQATLGATLTLCALASAALVPIGSLLGSLQTLQEAAAYIERLADIMESEPEKRGPVTGLVPRGHIELRGVSYRYDSQSPWTLRDVSLKVRPGEKVALVGRSGSGKSTLARILLGLYDPTEGDLCFDGVPLRKLDRQALRRHFGVVTQEPHLFTGTIRENICLSRPDATWDEMVEAAGLACVRDDIEAMPLGYDTVLAEGGGLSGGQRQRIALARALLNRPRVLVLDEATSHLDTVTEARIEEHLSWHTQTRIVIAHRLSTVRDADQIFVMHEGGVAEHGTHDSLLARGGFYAELVAGQHAFQA
ncbi:peptidase domain-containing ABC transporter [Nonomuraea soli]|uniref:ABC-type bacteriocin/lantibiotic exporter with double-glycine peptidase domain n=1 Tax=Nonomuraea soli TaxID=1032476 RepID=A0A7W0CI93_9ACTN|nr:peptidase domain-containing ABC transporter [Nonomuraea soli]MBA2891440.1 ABC-type bacteriocin/lantibiotic exporter with double-glycine peptidase domain [Nonomuraea soli]